MDYELIFWVILGIGSAVVMLGSLLFGRTIDPIDITWGKERDWNRIEKGWYK